MALSAAICFSAPGCTQQLVSRLCRAHVVITASEDRGPAWQSYTTRHTLERWLVWIHSTPRVQRESRQHREPLPQRAPFLPSANTAGLSVGPQCATAPLCSLAEPSPRAPSPTHQHVWVTCWRLFGDSLETLCGYPLDTPVIRQLYTSYTPVPNQAYPSVASPSPPHLSSSRASKCM